MALKLIERGDSVHERREILVTKDEFLIGRGADCDLCLNEAEVSRHHCLLRGRGSEYVLVDLGSSNGTFLNDGRVVSQAPVKSGDTVRIGLFQFQISLGDDDRIVWGNPQGATSADATCRVRRVRGEGGAPAKPDPDRPGDVNT